MSGRVTRGDIWGTVDEATYVTIGNDSGDSTTFWISDLLDLEKVVAALKAKCDDNPVAHGPAATRIEGIYNTVEEIEAAAEACLDAISDLEQRHPTTDASAAIAVYMRSYRLSIMAQDQLALIAELRRLRGEPVKVYP